MLNKWVCLNTKWHSVAATQCHKWILIINFNLCVFLACSIYYGFYNLYKLMVWILFFFYFSYCVVSLILAFLSFYLLGSQRLCVEMNVSISLISYYSPSFEYKCLIFIVVSFAYRNKFLFDFIVILLFLFPFCLFFYFVLMIFVNNILNTSLILLCVCVYITVRCVWENNKQKKTLDINFYGSQFVYAQRFFFIGKSNYCLHLKCISSRNINNTNKIIIDPWNSFSF